MSLHFIYLDLKPELVSLRRWRLIVVVSFVETAYKNDYLDTNIRFDYSRYCVDDKGICQDKVECTIAIVPYSLAHAVPNNLANIGLPNYCFPPLTLSSAIYCLRLSPILLNG